MYVLGIVGLNRNYARNAQYIHKNIKIIKIHEYLSEIN